MAEETNKLPPYDHDHENEVMPFAAANYRNKMTKFGIKTDDRRRHVYIVGKTGMGKTTLMENMFLHDVYAGHGCCYVDPHGDTAEKLLDFIPPHRINDVIYFNPADMENPIGFNIFEIQNEGQKHLVAAGLMSVFKKIWEGMWSSRMEYILLNTILALLDFPGSTLLGINRMLSDEEYRKRVVSITQDPVVKTFWVKEFASFSDKYRTEAVAPVQNKVGQFLSASIIRNIVAQVKSTMQMREIMDGRKILLLNLSKGAIGEENSRLLGGMIITRLQLAAMERVDTPEAERQDFFLYVDEFQNFATESFANILSEARKYRLALTVAHQYIEQLSEEVAAAIFGNVGTIISFRVGSPDAIKLVQEFTPRFIEEDLVGLRKFEIYLKLMIDGAASEPFSANTLPPINQRTGSTEKVIKVSRERYSTPRAKIEDKVLKWSGMGTADTGSKIQTEEEREEAEAKKGSAEAAVKDESKNADNKGEKPDKADAAAPGQDEPAKPVPDDDEDDDEKRLEEKLKALQASSPDIPEPAKPAGKKKKPQFEMPCSVCGKVSKLNFEPDKSRPWFCKEHLEERQKAIEDARASGKRIPTSREMAAMAPPPQAEGKDIPPPIGLSALTPPPEGKTPDRPDRQRKPGQRQPDKPKQVFTPKPFRPSRPPKKGPKGLSGPSGPPPRFKAPPPASKPPAREKPVSADKLDVKPISLSALVAREEAEKKPQDKPPEPEQKTEQKPVSLSSLTLHPDPNPLPDKTDQKTEAQTKPESQAATEAPPEKPESGEDSGSNPLQPGQVIKF